MISSYFIILIESIKQRQGEKDFAMQSKGNIQINIVNDHVHVPLSRLSISQQTTHVQATSQRQTVHPVFPQ